MESRTDCSPSRPASATLTGLIETRWSGSLPTWARWCPSAPTTASGPCEPSALTAVSLAVGEPLCAAGVSRRRALICLSIAAGSGWTICEATRTQFEALDLARGRLRELGDELHPARVFVRRERILHEGLELVGEPRHRGRALGADDVRAGLDEAVAIRPRDHRALAHGRVAQEDGLDLER